MKHARWLNSHNIYWIFPIKTNTHFTNNFITWQLFSTLNSCHSRSFTVWCGPEFKVETSCQIIKLFAKCVLVVTENFDSVFVLATNTQLPTFSFQLDVGFQSTVFVSSLLLLFMIWSFVKVHGETFRVKTVTSLIEIWGYHRGVLQDSDTV